MVDRNFAGKIVAALNQTGWSARKLAPFFTVSHQTILNWIMKWCKKG